MKDGQKLFESRELFKQFENDFRKYTFEAKATFEKILSQNLTEQNAERFLYTVADLWKFYSKTEFFYTDGAAQAKSSENLSNNLKAFEQIKSDGRLMLNALIFEENNYFNRFLSKVSEKFNIGTKELQYYSIKEILDLFNDKRVLDETIAKRKEFFFKQGMGGNIIYGEGEELRAKFNHFLRDDKAELKGVVANKGKVRGKVKIFPPSYYSDFSILKKLIGEMEKGDILVAETTSPELMPACQKAGAILTNQGGMLSHAAIVSRELNIPCIVGLGNVVQILKDGMEVEIDANTGTVKILK